MVRAIIQYRQFIFSCVRREFQARYRKSLFGSSWAIFNPLAMIIVYTVIFSQVMKTKIAGIDNTFSYSIYLCAGTLTWGLFVEIITRSSTVFLDNANLLKKLTFPRICLPVAVISSAILNFSIIFSLFLLFLIITGNFPGLPIMAILPLLAIQILLSVGLGVFLGVLNVFFRDVGQLLGIVMQFWFWLTPIVYPASILPQWLSVFISWNPMTQIIGAYQTIFVQQKWPDYQGPAVVTGVAIIICIFAVRIYRKHVGEMVDEL